jgi:acetyltransferase-like isoleucine patch superfamily enzyme
MKYLKYIFNIIFTLLNKLIYRNSFSSFTNDLYFSTRLYNCNIGKYNYIGPGVLLNRVVMKNYCSIAPNVVVGGMEHDYSNFSTSTKLYPHNKFKTTVIQDDVWIGANAVIRTGLKIGKGSIIGANAVVLQDVPPMSIVVGNPARILKKRFNDIAKEKKFMKIDFSDTRINIHNNFNNH